MTILLDRTRLDRTRDAAHASLAAIPATEPIVLVGKVAPLTADGRLSGIAKAPVTGPWSIARDGLVDDAQADLENHGGPEKAVHQYPFDHYALWRAEVGEHPLLATAGGFGENLSTTGWTEATVHIGDVVRFGAVVLQISQGRQPCWKLNARFALKKMAFEVQMSGRTGWYYRVLEPGIARPGDTLAIIDRPCPDWPLQRLIGVLYKKTGDLDALAAMAEMPELAEDWRVIARRRLESRRTEDWTGRLDGPSAKA